MSIGTNSILEPVRISSNWAVATWCGVSVVSYQVCQYYRSKEKAGIKQAQVLMEKKRVRRKRGEKQEKNMRWRSRHAN
jgi:cytochrome c oxidase assembly protein subunit 20